MEKKQIVRTFSNKKKYIEEAANRNLAILVRFGVTYEPRECLSRGEVLPRALHLVVGCSYA